jgi:phage terminase small subunit
MDENKASTLTLKQEAFCNAYIENGGNASAAYRTAYNAENMGVDSVKVEACRLLDSPNIALTVKALRDAIALANRLTVDDLIKELEEARIAALTAETVQSSAATAATMGKAKLLGYDKQTLELTGKDGKDLYAALTDEQLEARIAAIAVKP